jgi:hypothetical protein
MHIAVVCASSAVLPALMFAAARWHNASSITIGGMGGENETEEVYAVVTGPALPTLGHLKINWSAGPNTLAVLLAHFAAKAQMLEELFLTLAHATPVLILPCFGNLKQLQLSFIYLDMHVLALALLGLPCLKKLSMRSRQAPYLQSQDLNLSGLRCLETLDMSHIVPQTLQLPGSCALNLELVSTPAAGFEVWRQCGRNLRSLTLGTSGEPFESIAAVFDAFPVPVEDVLIFADSIGSDAANPLQLAGSIVRAKSLYLRTNQGMYLRLPERITWNDLYIHAGAELLLDIPNMQDFVQHMPGLSVFCETLHASSSGNLMQLAVHAERLGRKVQWRITPEGFTWLAIHQADSG